MAMPKTKRNRTFGRNRRAFYYRKVPTQQTTKCQLCGALKRAHYMCGECGAHTNGKGNHLQLVETED